MRLREIKPINAVNAKKAAKQEGVGQNIGKTSKGTKTLSAGELRVNALADQASKLRKQEKQERARQGLAKAQQRMAKASSAL